MLNHNLKFFFWWGLSFYWAAATVEHTAQTHLNLIGTKMQRSYTATVSTSIRKIKPRCAWRCTTCYIRLGLHDCRPETSSSHIDYTGILHSTVQCHWNVTKNHCFAEFYIHFPCVSTKHSWEHMQMELNAREVWISHVMWYSGLYHRAVLWVGTNVYRKLLHISSGWNFKIWVTVGVVK